MNKEWHLPLLIGYTLLLLRDRAQGFKGQSISFRILLGGATLVSVKHNLFVVPEDLITVMFPVLFFQDIIGHQFNIRIQNGHLLEFTAGSEAVSGDKFHGRRNRHALQGFHTGTGRPAKGFDPVRKFQCFQIQIIHKSGAPDLSDLFRKTVYRQFFLVFTAWIGNQGIS